MSNCYKNPSSGNRVVPCGQTDGQTDRETGMTKLIVAFRNAAKASKNYKQFTEFIFDHYWDSHEI
jgi:hypothetical protein